MLPLYSSETRQSLTNTSNPGLRFEKFFDRWNAIQLWMEGRNNKPIPDDAKAAYVRQFARQVGDEDQLEEYAERIRALVCALHGMTVKAKTQRRLITGTGLSHPIEVGFAWHHTMGVPYIPGSGLKGIVREWAERWGNAAKPEVDRILGRSPVAGETGSVGRVVFLDAVPVARVKLAADVMTPHYGEYYQDKSGKTAPGDWLSPTPIPFLTVADAQVFQSALVPAHPLPKSTKNSQGQDEQQRRSDLETAAGWLKAALEQLGAGAKTAAGYGRFVADINKD